VYSVLQRNRDRILDLIENASQTAGRPTGAVQLLAVTKSVSSALAMALVRAGQTDLGENRIDVFEQKLLDFREHGVEARWHFIGHIQRNKAARVVRASDVIHSVDSVNLLKALNRHAEAAGRKPSIYLQVKLTDEDAKHGLSEVELHEALACMPELYHLELVGLMGMAPRVAEANEKQMQASASFEALASLAAELPADLFATGRPQLSMGMSGDFEQAIAAGADIVRVGSALFTDVDQSAIQNSSDGPGGNPA
jgi:pyridoxal phosphate enzyme (YggS family)